MAKKLTIEEIKRRLKNRHNIESDELETLFNKSEDEIRAFYSKVVMRAKKFNTLKEEADGEGPIAEDTFELPPEKTEVIEKAEKRKKKIRQALEKESFEQGAAPLEHLPVEQRVTFEDTQQALRDLGKLDLDEL